MTFTVQVRMDIRYRAVAMESTLGRGGTKSAGKISFFSFFTFSYEYDQTNYDNFGQRAWLPVEA